MRLAITGLIRLARPANLPTAMADVLAGLAIAGWFGTSALPYAQWTPVLFLVVASAALYAGGVVLNDVFDIAIDRLERPERPIPSGMVSKKTAAVFGLMLLITGILLAYLVKPLSGLVAALLAGSILLYDGYTKKFSLLGPLNMGVCRGLNLFLGLSVLGSLSAWWYALIPLVYIFAITLISRGEVHGDNKKHIIWAAILYALVIFIVLYIIMVQLVNVVVSLIFLCLFGFLVYKPLINAYRINSAPNIKKAVMAGVLSVIVLDATLAVPFTNIWYGLLILLLWPLSRGLAKIFAVT